MKLVPSRGYLSPPSGLQVSSFEQTAQGVCAVLAMTGGLHCPGTNQRHQALFGLVALPAYATPTTKLASWSPGKKREKILRREEPAASKSLLISTSGLGSAGLKLRGRPAAPNGVVEYSDGMSAEDAERFRRHADGCHQKAGRAINPLDKEAWLLLADDWIKMPQAAEER